jgi:formamidopyrimidine-DNA glycosylase
MTGRLLYRDNVLKSRHTHLVIQFNKTGCLVFHDIRTFGRVIYLPDGDWRQHPRILRLGPEPLEIRRADFLKSVLPIRSQRAVKVLLMEQSFLCGLGNIYCDESLFAAGIHPKRPASGLSHREWETLLTSIKRVLRKGIRNCGTTFSDYRQPDGAPGTNQDRLWVYGRGGENCLKCGSALEKMRLGQRTTVYCPACQG